MDPAKLKVVDLRAELSKRGLDSKGVKAALVKRLKEALEQETKQEIPDTSIADTSTEDLDTSQASESEVEETKPPEKEPSPKKETKSPAKSETKVEAKAKPPLKDDKPMEVEKTPSPKKQVVKKAPESKPESKPEAPSQPKKSPEEVKPPSTEAITLPVEPKPKRDAEQNLENGEQDDSKSRKSRWGAEADIAEPSKDEAAAPTEESNQSEQSDGKTEEEPESKVDSESKGEKRKRSSQSPDRSQRRRSRSPIKEDEPVIDHEKVQLSWYDSDLHLQLDKESFLSAKPYHDGAFGYAWAGVRATHGANTGKVCFEVKITEELKFEDFAKYYEKSKRDQHRSDSRHRSSHDKRKSEKSDVDSKSKTDEKTKKDSVESKPENGEANEKDADKEEATEGEKKKEAMEVDESPEGVAETSDDITEAKSGEKIATAEPSKDGDKTAEEKEGEAKEQEGEDKGTDSNEKKEADSKEEKGEAMDTEEIKEPIPTHFFRVGWSLQKSSLQLGEDKNSYGYESSGNFVTDKQFSPYGIAYGVGDTITAFLDAGETEILITYAVNGVAQPTAVTIPRSELPEDVALFPHVLSRNYAFELNLGSRDEAWFAKPAEFESFEFLDKAENKIAGPVRPEQRSECEVVLMCGLPASGKTHWVNEYIQSNPDKQYTVLGNTHFLDKMTVSGNPLKTKFQGSWNLLLDKLQKSLNKLVDNAALRRRNYIIDQPNVFPSAQRRKLRPFEGFKRRAVVVVVGDEEQAKRQSLQDAQGGKEIPDSTILEMKANMSIPQKGDWIDEVIFAGVEEAEAKTIVQKYNTQGREAGYGGAQKRFGYRDDRHRWQNRRIDYRGGNYRDRSYHNNRYERGPPRQGSWQPHRPGGWNRDHRDSRGPPGGGSRDWRNNRGGGQRDRGHRDSQLSSYNRSRNPPPGRSSGGGSWQSGGGSWPQSQGNWGSSQSWNNQGQWSGQGWSGQSGQNQWKYGGGGSGGSGQGYGNYSNWNYYGQYAQNWNPQGQTQAAGGATAATQQYGQYTQQEWAQYAQQYAQQGQTTTALTHSAHQK